MLEYYNVKYTDVFNKRLKETIYYISEKIGNKSVANALLDNVKKAIVERSKSPKIDKPYKKLDGKNVYKIKIRNFYVFYILNEKEKNMNCITFVYARSDFNKRLI